MPRRGAASRPRLQSVEKVQDALHEAFCQDALRRSKPVAGPQPIRRCSTGTVPVQVCSSPMRRVRRWQLWHERCALDIAISQRQRHAGKDFDRRGKRTDRRSRCGGGAERESDRRVPWSGLGCLGGRTRMPARVLAHAC
eukprot:3090032-Pleurochrysis_carterae.AAC.1